MTPKIVTSEDQSDLPAASAVTVMEKLAQNASLRTIASLAMIVVGFLFPVFCTVGGWVAVRVITTMDRLVDQQVVQNDKIIALQGRFDGKMQLLDLTDLHLDAKLVETDNRLNKRIDQVSDRTQRNATDIDNLKEKVYPLLPRTK